MRAKPTENIPFSESAAALLHGGAKPPSGVGTTTDPEQRSCEPKAHDLTVADFRRMLPEVVR